MDDAIAQIEAMMDPNYWSSSQGTEAEQWVQAFTLLFTLTDEAGGEKTTYQVFQVDRGQHRPGGLRLVRWGRNGVALEWGHPDVLIRDAAEDAGSVYLSRTHEG